jgi:hypothetical protein
MSIYLFIYLFGIDNIEMDFHVILLNAGWKVKKERTLRWPHEDRRLLGRGAMYFGRHGTEFWRKRNMC